ncbi:hypothetical protein ACU63N_07020 [Klebsiella aerogenes]
MSIFSNQTWISIYIILLSLLLIIFMWRKWYILDKRNLFQQKLFWISIGVPLFSFIYFGIFSWWGKTPVLSAHGYARFYEITKFPLLLLASSVPLASIVNNIHRTIQTEAQIQAAETKNAIDRHLAHEKNFVEKAKEVLTYDIRSIIDHKGELKTIVFPGDETDPTDETMNLFKALQINVKNPYLLYSTIYSKSTTKPTSDYTPCVEFFEKIDSLFKSIDDNLNFTKEIELFSPTEYIERLTTISNNTALLLDILNIECTSNLRIIVRRDNNSLIMFANEEIILMDLLEAAFYMTKKIISIAYGVELKNYYHLHDYLYSGNSGFNFRKYIVEQTDFYSPEWKAYTSSLYCIHPDGDILAAEQ